MFLRKYYETQRLFLSLSQEDKDKVTSIIIDAGIGIEVGSIVFRDFLKAQMWIVTGKSREYIKLFRRLDKDQQERFYKAFLSYED